MTTITESESNTISLLRRVATAAKGRFPEDIDSLDDLPREALTFLQYATPGAVLFLLDTIAEKDAEIKSWRDRCPVTVEDVSACNLTRAKVDAWLLANGWTMRTRGKRETIWQHEGGRACTLPTDIDNSVRCHWLVERINGKLAYVADLAPQTVLAEIAEMAAMEDSP